MRKTAKDLVLLKDIYKRQKGLPVGIPTGKNRAKRLVALELAEYAPCSYLHRLKNYKKLSSVCCTTTGEFYAGGKLS